ncbi:MAG TPA: AAA family ATPase [Isosphaeraceae bacterium]|jgi:hypothetical protein|nr:AAA family ATPase [Isosphaeraceae bacterium]
MIKPTQIDIYALSRLQIGADLNGEAGRVSPAVGRLAQALAPAGTEAERGLVWEGFLAGLDDPAAIFKAMAEVDPHGPAPGTEEEASRPRAKVVKTSLISTKKVEWLWEDRVPLGTLSLFAGDPKLGKSFVTLALAAGVSRGATLPGAAGAVAGDVVILSAEDDPARTIVPRLKAADANLDRCHLLEAVYLADGAEALPNLRADIDAIEEAVKGTDGCRLIIIDPVSAYLGSTDDHKNSELRGVLSPLKSLAERLDVAVVLVSHLNKGAGTNAKYRVSGSIAYVGACRANFLFVKDKDDPTGRRVLFLPVGCNLGPEPPGLAYVIGDRGHGPAVEWEADPVAVKVEDALAAAAEDDQERCDRSECETWLKEVLKDAPLLQTEIMATGRACGFGQMAIQRALSRSAVVFSQD